MKSLLLNTVVAVLTLDMVGKTWLNGRETLGKPNNTSDVFAGTVLMIAAAAAGYGGWMIVSYDGY